MKKIFLIAALVAFVLPATAQKREINAHWCALGTSITWYNENVATARGGFTKGYQTRVKEKLDFKQYTNKGVNGGELKTAIPQVIKADYYTIEHGVNDWHKKVPVGTIDDYINNTNNGTFAAEYRKLIDAIYKANPKAKIVICTPRQGAGFRGTNGPYTCPYDPRGDINGVYLKDYADMARQIAEFESIPVADFFGTCANWRNIYQMSLNNARAADGLHEDGVHPNDDSYQMMANLLIDALEKVLVD